MGRGSSNGEKKYESISSSVNSREGLIAEDILYGRLKEPSLEKKHLYLGPLIVGAYKDWRPRMGTLGLDRTYANDGWVGNEAWQVRGKLPKKWYWTSSRPVSSSVREHTTAMINIIEHSVLAEEPPVYLGPIEEAHSKKWRRLQPLIKTDKIPELYVNADHLEGALSVSSEAVTGFHLFVDVDADIGNKHRLAALDADSDFIAVFAAVPKEWRSADG